MITKLHVSSAVALKNRFKHSKDAFKRNTNEFLRNTTIHGLQYIIRDEFNIFERLFFVISFMSVVLACAYFSLNVIVEWNTTPTIVSISPNPTYITDEPFPAITICNLNQADKRKVDHLSISSTKYAMLEMLCKREVNATIADTISDWSTLKNFMIDIAQPCHRMLVYCRFGGVEYNCSQLFHPIVMKEGLCCTFNMLDPKFMYISGTSNVDYNISHPKNYTTVDWNLEQGYMTKPLPKYFTPRKTLGTGETLGLTMVLDVEASNYYCSLGNSIAFKMSIHNANELPNILETGVPITPGAETKVRMVPIKTEAAPQLREVAKESRQCYFNGEMKLNVFRFYTTRNCEVECISDMLLQNCGCVAHYMHSVQPNSTTCSIYDSSCVEQVRTRAVRANYGKNCRDYCWPSCYDFRYRLSYFSLVLMQTGFELANPVLRNYSSSYIENNIAIVNMYRKEYSYRSNVQSDFINAVDVLSSFGGLICIFFGFSFISLTEFIFYTMIRPFRPLRGAQARLGAPVGTFARTDSSTTSTYLPLAQRARNRLRNPFVYPTYSIYAQKRSVLYPARRLKRLARREPKY